MGKLALFWSFSITASSLPSDSLATFLSLHAPRLTPHLEPGVTVSTRSVERSQKMFREDELATRSSTT